MFAEQVYEPDDDQPRWARGLNDQQRRAVEHEGAAVLVVAGAGSGKTRTLASRVARLLGDGADPERILLLTFSRRASREMLQRAERLHGDRSAGRVWGGTFHAIGNRLLREHGRAVGLANGFTILDQGDAADLMGVVRSDLGFAERGSRFPKKDTLLDIYSRVVNAQEKLDEVLRVRFPWCHADAAQVAQVFTGYTERKRSRGILDYDDLLLYWRALMTSSPLAGAIAERFDHVLVDEYQDTNLLQADIVHGLSPTGEGLFVVGDDAQAIYGFRAASAANMSEFADRFPGTMVITLDRNYRSVQPVLDVANAVMAKARGIHPKELVAARTDIDAATANRPVLARAADETAEADFVCDQVLAHREQGIALRDQAVLFRTGHHSARLEVELSRRNIPFVKYGGLKFLEAAHVKDLLAFLRLLENPSDELAWHRVLSLLEGFGPATARAVMTSLELPNPDAVRSLVDAPLDVPARARGALGVLRATLSACLEVGADTSPAVEIEAIRNHAKPLFEGRYQDADVRLTDLDQLAGMAASVATRAQFLAELTLDPPSRTSDLAGVPHLDDDWLVLSTIHSAKGGEWTAVYVIHAADGNIPSDMATTGPDGIEEERRLFYVALTRAKDHLYVSYPVRFYFRPRALDDSHAFSQPSRFLRPATGLLDEPPAEAEEVLLGTRHVPDGPDLVTAQVTSLWS